MKIETKQETELKDIIEQAFDAGSVGVFFPQKLSPQYRTGAAALLRGVASEVWVTPRALEAKNWAACQVCHMGQVTDRVTEYTTGTGWGDAGMVFFTVPEDAVEIVVIDLKEYNDSWDAYAGMGEDAQRDALRVMGAQFVKVSVRGHKSFDDVKTAYNRLVK